MHTSKLSNIPINSSEGPAQREAHTRIRIYDFTGSLALIEERPPAICSCVEETTVIFICSIE